MNLYGREVIYTDVDEIDASNLSKVLQDAINAHRTNVSQIEKLYEYYRGKQDILQRVKKVRQDICNYVTENRALSIVDFKTGYLVGEPIQYVSSAVNDNGASQSVIALNEYMQLEDKHAKDIELVKWQMICGTAYRMVLPRAEQGEDESPFEILTLDPRSAFVIYSSKLGHRPMACVYIIVKDNKKKYCVYTHTKYFEFEDRDIVAEYDYTLGDLPIIEYPANIARLGVFEPVKDLLDAINNIASNRMDAIEQFVQSLIVCWNCQFDDGEDATSMREKGLLLLTANGEFKQDIKVLTEELNQTQTQTLKDDMYEAVLQIVGMPSQSRGNTSDSSNNGAMILKQGWQTAEARAKDSETIISASERTMLKLVLKICRAMPNTGVDVALKNIAIKFTRRNYEDIATKTNVLVSLLNNGKVDPLDAYTVPGLFADPEEACARGLKWYEKLKSEMEQTLSDEINTDETTETTQPTESGKVKLTDEE